MAALLLCGMAVYIVNPRSIPNAGGVTPLGKWKAQGSTETVEFRSDGSYLGRDRYGRKVTGTFELLSANKIELELTTSSVDERTGAVNVDRASGTCRFEVQGETLRLAEDDGTATRYQRAE